MDDTGPGVPSTARARIFEEFGHADASDAARFDGAGLGLSICRQVIDRMDGRIWAENNKGRGATFAFDLTAPRAVVEAEAPFEAGG